MKQQQRERLCCYFVRPTVQRLPLSAQDKVAYTHTTLTKAVFGQAPSRYGYFYRAGSWPMP